MRRLASSFLTVWSVIAVPSLIVWGLLVRSGPNGTERFARVWHWFVDRLAYPLVLSPLTDPSWQALEAGSDVGATTGFFVLVAVWAAMLALPLVLLASWWHVLQRRLDRPSYAGGYSGSGLPGSEFSEYALPPPRRHRSPLSPLYVITIPIALIWNGSRKILAGLFGSNGHVVVCALLVLVFSSGLVVGVMALAFGFSSYRERQDILRFIGDSVWFGYLDTLRVPRLFDDRWMESYLRIGRVSRRAQLEDWPAYMGQWYRHAEFRTLVWVTALRHGLLMVEVYLGYRLIRRLTS